MLAYLLVTLWGLLGLLTFIKCVYEEGQFIVEDFKMIPILMLAGPIPALFIAFDKYKDVILWKREAK